MAGFFTPAEWRPRRSDPYSACGKALWFPKRDVRPWRLSDTGRRIHGTVPRAAASVPPRKQTLRHVLTDDLEASNLRGKARRVELNRSILRSSTHSKEQCREG